MDAPAATDTTSGRLGRVRSIDLLRGLDVLLMLFVNEIAGVQGTPAFLLHKPATVDGMTATDVVFPAFLFITGMAIPFALGGRLRRGHAREDVWRHVLTRTLALVVIGVFMVNAERTSEQGVLSPHLWNVLVTVAVFLVWQAPASESGARWHTGLRAVGLALLVVLAFAYRSSEATGLLQLRPRWWGILGLVGWAYLVAATVYLFVGERSAVLVGFVALLYGLYLADEVAQFGWLVALRPYFSVGRVVASHAAVVVAGTVLGVMLVRHQRDGGLAHRFVPRALGYAAGLAVAGLLLHALRGLHTAFWISKIMATPPWCLLSSAITCIAWVVVFGLADVKRWPHWPKSVSIAGENALVAYLLAPALLSLFALSAPLFGGTNPYHALGQNVWVGFIRSAIFAWAVVRLCGTMRRYGIRMQL